MSPVDETLIRDVVSEALGQVDGCLTAVSNMSWRRMPFAKNFFVADGLGHGAIQVQCRQSGASGGAEANRANAVPTEMQAPRVVAGIKQANLLAGLRITRRQSCAFAQRAGDTSQSEIAESCLAASVNGNDVVNVESCFLRSLGEAAVFAPILRPMKDLTPKLRRDGHAATGGRCSSAGNEAGATRADHSGRLVPRLRASRRASTGRRDPAYQANREAASVRPWATETSPDRPASALSVGWLETYSLPVSAGQSIRPQQACPRLESPNPYSSVSIRS